jgi:hypothetical protein
VGVLRNEEAAVDEHHLPALPENQIWSTGKQRNMQAVAIAELEAQIEQKLTTNPIQGCRLGALKFEPTICLIAGSALQVRDDFPPELSCVSYIFVSLTFFRVDARAFYLQHNHCDLGVISSFVRPYCIRDRGKFSTKEPTL